MASMNVMDARRYVKVGQAAAVVLGLSAATLWALDVPGLSRALPPKPDTHPASAEAPKPAATAVKPVDRATLAAMAGRLEIGSGVKKPEAPKEDTTIAEAPVEPPPSAGPEWRYLGPIQEPNRLLALISVEDHQKVIAEGRSYGEMRLVSVASDEIVIENKATKERRHVARADRSETSPRVAWIKNMPANTPPSAGGAGQPGQPGIAVAGNQQLSPEARARMIERGIDPEQAQRWRQRMNERRGRDRERAVPGGGGARGAVGAADPAADASVSATAVFNGQVLAPGQTAVKFTDQNGTVRVITTKPSDAEAAH